MHQVAHMRHLWGWVALLKTSVEMTEMYCSFINKWFILNKLQIKNVLNGELVSLFLLSEDEPCLCSMLRDQKLCIYSMFPSENYL